MISLDQCRAFVAEHAGIEKLNDGASSRYQPGGRPASRLACRFEREIIYALWASSASISWWRVADNCFADRTTHFAGKYSSAVAFLQPAASRVIRAMHHGTSPSLTASMVMMRIRAVICYKKSRQHHQRATIIASQLGRKEIAKTTRS